MRTRKFKKFQVYSFKFFAPGDWEVNGSGSGVVLRIRNYLLDNALNFN